MVFSHNCYPIKIVLLALTYMDAMCTWNKTWEVGKLNLTCFTSYCDSPDENLLKAFSLDDWCIGGFNKTVKNETHSWEYTHKLDEAERREVERLCMWDQNARGYTLDMVECYATHCDNPNTTVNELFNYNLAWSRAANSPMTPVETYIRYPCKAGTRLVDRELWWKEDALEYDDIYCGLDGNYQYRDPWYYCYPGKGMQLNSKEIFLISKIF